MVRTAPLIQLQPKKKELPLPLKVLTSLKTTAVLGTVLGGLIVGPAAVGRGALAVGKFIAPKTPRGIITAVVGVPTAIGVLAGSPKARSFIGGIVDPRKQIKKGKTIGGIIEDPSKLLPKDKTLGAKIKETAKTAGIAAGAAAALVGGAALIPKIKEKFTTPKAAVPLAALPSQVTPQIQPFGVAEKAPSIIEKPPATVPREVPSIKNVFKPSIDISFRKTRKFINQQVHVN